MSLKESAAMARVVALALCLVHTVAASERVLRGVAPTGKRNQCKLQYGFLPISVLRLYKIYFEH